MFYRPWTVGCLLGSGAVFPRTLWGGTEDLIKTQENEGGEGGGVGWEGRNKQAHYAVVQNKLKVEWTPIKKLLSILVSDIGLGYTVKLYQLIYKSDNIIYHNWGRTSVFRPLSYPSI